MASVKRRALNDHLLDTFISMLGLSPTVIIAGAKAVRTLDVGHTPSHRVDTQTGQVAYESDF
ncbi:MAG: hypothetical protein V7K40_02075 [Nostoc sp.]